MKKENNNKNFSQREAWQKAKREANRPKQVWVWDSSVTGHWEKKEAQ